jgi:hypothetical protein
MNTATVALVKPKTCRRCSGKGFVEFGRVVYAGLPQTCFKCAGAGVVESDRATLAAAKARAEATQGIILAAVAALESAGVPRHQAVAVSYGIDHLSINAPERYEAALVSFQNGHAGLVRALWAYTAEAGYLYYGARHLTVAEALALLDN